MDYSTLPLELLSTIFSFLTCKDLTSAVCVNSTWNNLVNYDNVWKEAIFNSSFPHPFSYSKRGVTWRQIVKRHFQTRRNISNGRCVQHIIGKKCSGLFPREGTVGIHQWTVSGKYCLLIWTSVSSYGRRAPYHTHRKTELWDLENRRLIKNYSSQNLCLFNDYIIEKVHEQENTIRLNYSAVDFDGLDDGQSKSIDQKLPTIHFSPTKLTPNTDKESSLIALHADLINGCLVYVFDLRTGKKVLEKKLASMTILQFHGPNMVLSDINKSDSVLLLNVLEDKEVLIKEDCQVGSKCALLYNELWLVGETKQCLIKYEISTMKRHEYFINEDTSKITCLSIINGIIWLLRFTDDPFNLLLVDISSSNECQIIGRFGIEGYPTISQLPNGTISLISTSYACTMSFKDEDFELPIQVLQIEPDGENEVLNIRQCDLYQKMTESNPTPEPQIMFKDPASVSSHVVLKDQDERYSVMFSCRNAADRINPFIDKAKKLRDESKTDARTLPLYGPSIEQNTDIARGSGWIVYETKVNGGWQRAAPHDDWSFFKTKLGLK